MHSSGASASIGCRFLIPGESRLKIFELQLDLPAPCAELGARDAQDADRSPPICGGRDWRGSSASNPCRNVVPLRGRPVMKIGGASGRVRIVRILALRVREDQKRREHSLEVPTRREASEGRQRRLLAEAGGQSAKRLDKVRVRERLGVEARRLRASANNGSGASPALSSPESAPASRFIAQAITARHELQ